MNLRYFEIKYFRWALMLLVLGFFVVSIANCFKPFHQDVFFVEQDSFKSTVIAVQDCDTDDTKNSDIESGDDGYKPLSYFPLLKNIAFKRIKYNPLLIPRFHLSTRNSRAPPVYFLV